MHLVAAIRYYAVSDRFSFLFYTAYILLACLRMLAYAMPCHYATCDMLPSRRGALDDFITQTIPWLIFMTPFIAARFFARY